MIQPTAATIANNVRLQRSQFAGAFLVTEGSVDAQFYRQQIDAAQAQVIVGFGKGNVAEALRILRAGGVDGVLGAVDADFGRLRGITVGGELIVSDEHDVEMTLFRSPALDKLLDSLGSDAKLRAYDAANGGVRDGLLSVAAPIGALRLVSLDMGGALKFEGLRYSKFITSTLECDIPRMVQVALENSGFPSIDRDELLARVRSEMDAGHDLYQLCSGHDVLAILGIGLRRTLGSADHIDVQERRLARSMVLAYERSHFRTTDTYERISDWERDNPPYRILAR